MDALNKKLLAARPLNGIRNVSFTAKNGVATMSFDQTFGLNPKFSRSVHKVALGNLAFYEGLDAARDEKYDAVRSFVREGKGNFRVVVMERQDERRSVFGSPWAGADSTHSMVGMTILGVSLLIDLDPDQKGLAHIWKTAPKEERLMMIPPDAQQPPRGRDGT